MAGGPSMGGLAPPLRSLALFAYRLADAVGRPYAATASGHDWAYIKEQNLPGLVRGWIAYAYAAGHRLMAPHRQWCYTPEKGTHWYQGPADKFAPLYQFVRRNTNLFDDLETFADVTVVCPHRSFIKDRDFWFKVCNQLATANLFLIPLDHRREWYRYHRLFAEVLRATLGASVSIQLKRAIGSQAQA